jgi:hypothetical protein
LFAHLIHPSCLKSLDRTGHFPSIKPHEMSRSQKS